MGAPGRLELVASNISPVGRGRPTVLRQVAPSRVLGAVALAVTLLAVLPLGFVLWVTDRVGPTLAGQLILRPKVAELLVNSMLLVLIAVPLCAILAGALAWLIERTDLPGRRRWSWLMVAPLAVPAFIQGYAWITLVPSLSGLPAAILVSVTTYFPFMYLPVTAALRRLDPAWEQAAASMGLSPLRVFCRVVLPQMRLALLGGTLLIGLHLLAEYGLFAMLRFDTFTTAIIDQFQSTFDGPAANMLGVVLVGCCLVLLWGESLVRGRARYARMGAGAARPASPAPLGRWKFAAILLPVVTVALSLGVPAFTLVGWLQAGGVRVWRWGEILPALGQTAALALGGGVLTVAASFPIAWLATRRPDRLHLGLERLCLLAGSLPGVVTALALVTVAVRLVHPLYQTAFTILLAYLVMFLPRALLGLRASLAQVPLELEHAAAGLGRSPARVLWAVTMRLAAPGMAASMALVSLGIATELTATQMLAPAGVQTLATAFWSYSGEIDYAAAAPYAVLMVLLSSPLTWLLYRQSFLAAGR